MWHEARRLPQVNRSPFSLHALRAGQSEFDNSGESSDGCHEHDAEPDRQAQREIVQLRVEVSNGRLQVGLGHQLSHDEISCCFRVREHLACSVNAQDALDVPA